MLVRPRDLADWMSDGHALTLTLPLEAARKHAKLSVSPYKAVSHQSLRSGGNSPTVRLNLPYGIFQLRISPKIV